MTEDDLFDIGQLIDQYIHGKGEAIQTVDDRFFTPNVPITVIDTIYLILYLETKYQLYFTREDLLSESFYSLSGLANIIKQKLA